MVNSVIFITSVLCLLLSLDQASPQTTSPTCPEAPTGASTCLPPPDPSTPQFTTSTCDCPCFSSCLKPSGNIMSNDSVTGMCVLDTMNFPETRDSEIYISYTAPGCMEAIILPVRGIARECYSISNFHFNLETRTSVRITINNISSMDNNTVIVCEPEAPPGNVLSCLMENNACTSSTVILLAPNSNNSTEESKTSGSLATSNGLVTASRFKISGIAIITAVAAARLMM